MVDLAGILSHPDVVHPSLSQSLRGEGSSILQLPIRAGICHEKEPQLDLDGMLQKALISFQMEGG